MQWAALALVGLVAYFVIIEPVTDWASQTNLLANEKAKELEALRTQAETRKAAVTELQSAARRFGEVLPPGPIDERVGVASQRINSILSRNQAGDVNLGSRPPVGLGSRTMPGFLEDEESFELKSVTFDVSFEGTPERCMAIIAELEQVPEITLIRDVDIDRYDRNGARLLVVSLSPEVWGVGRKGNAR